MLESRTQKSIVDHHERPLRQRRAGLRNVPDVGHYHRRVRGRFDQHHPQVPRRTDRRIDLLTLATRYRDTSHSERLEKTLDQGLRATIDGNRVHDTITWPENRQ